jgi:sortase (surface protein transpeptidase)
LVFVVYEVYVTDLFGERKQAEATTAVDQVWAEAEATATVVAQAPDRMVTDPHERVPRYETAVGTGFAKLRIPALGADYVFTVVEGTDPDDLYIGPGHYPETQLPGEQGNFAVAGHRVSKGSPFNDLGLLNSCDAIVVETQDDWFVYRVLPMSEEDAGWAATPRARCAGVQVQTGAYAGVHGQEITLPSDYAQVLPVPHVLSTTVPPDAQRLITLTTCHPQFSDAERMILHGVLVNSYAKAPGFLPPELTET